MSATSGESPSTITWHYYIKIRKWVTRPMIKCNSVLLLQVSINTIPCSTDWCNTSPLNQMPALTCSVVTAICSDITVGDIILGRSKLNGLVESGEWVNCYLTTIVRANWHYVYNGFHHIYCYNEAALLQWTETFMPMKRVHNPNADGLTSIQKAITINQCRTGGLKAQW